MSGNGMITMGTQKQSTSWSNILHWNAELPHKSADIETCLPADRLCEALLSSQSLSGKVVHHPPADYYYDVLLLLWGCTELMQHFTMILLTICNARSVSYIVWTRTINFFHIISYIIVSFWPNCYYSAGRHSFRSWADAFGGLHTSTWRPGV